jgi:hypothetical protein
MALLELAQVQAQAHKQVVLLALELESVWAQVK